MRRLLLTALVVGGLASPVHAEVTYLICKVDVFNRHNNPQKMKLEITLEVDSEAGSVRGTYPCPRFEIVSDDATGISFKGCGSLNGSLNRINGSIVVHTPFQTGDDGQQYSDWITTGHCKRTEKLF